MRIRDPINEADEPFNLVPLTDMVFNLLIFFMAATTFAQVEKEMGVQLPKATAAAATSSVPQQIIINIDQDGRAIVSRKPYDLEELRKLLVEVLRKNPQAKVILRADERGSVKGFAAVLAVCVRTGVQQANITYVGGGSAAP